MSLPYKVAGGWELRSSLTPDAYRQKAQENHKRGWNVVYLNSYVDKKQGYLSAIWLPGIEGEVRRRAELGKKDFDFQWQLARKLGLKTVAVTAYEVDGPAKYTAVFGD